MSEEEYIESNLPEEIAQLCSAYSTLVEVDTGLLDKREGNRLVKVKSRLLEVIINYCEALPLVED
jgi:hypothetical protein